MMPGFHVLELRSMPVHQLSVAESKLKLPFQAHLDLNDKL